MKKLQKGKKIGSYRIVKELEKSVEPSSRTYSYLADVPESGRVSLTFLDKDKILKELDIEEMSNADKNFKLDKILQQFKDNALFWKEVDHPNIAKMYNLIWDKDETGEYYIVREYISDLPLFEATNGLSPMEMIQLFIPLLKALYYLHTKKEVLHLNIKSKRIRVRMEDDGAYTIKFTDCGYAISFNDERVKDIKCGTPSYMPTELALRKSELIGPISDLQAFGILMYYCITRKLPFPGRLTAGTNLEKLAQIVSDEDLPLSPAAINKNCPTDLSNIVMNLLQSNPTARVYKDANDVVEALQKVLPVMDIETLEDEEVSIV